VRSGSWISTLECSLASACVALIQDAHSTYRLLYAMIPLIIHILMNHRSPFMDMIISPIPLTACRIRPHDLQLYDPLTITIIYIPFEMYCDIVCTGGAEGRSNRSLKDFKFGNEVPDSEVKPVIYNDRQWDRKYDSESLSSSMSVGISKPTSADILRKPSKSTTGSSNTLIPAHTAALQPTPRIRTQSHSTHSASGTCNATASRRPSLSP
jgi:hypothetical protein